MTAPTTTRTASGAPSAGQVPAQAPAGAPAPATAPATAAPAAPTRATMARALNEALRQSLAADQKVLLMGEDIGRLGGVFRITDKLHAEFGDDRVIDTPLAESGIVGTAIGLAMRGYRPVCEIQFDGFVFPAFDQITTQLAKLHSRMGGRIPLPVVIRIPAGGGIGAVEHHSESPESLFAHTAGLRVVAPGTPQDAFTMLRAAIECPDPVIFLEPKSRYWAEGDVSFAYDGQDAWDALNTARVARAGRDVTLAAYGASLTTALQAASAAADDGIEAEVLDLRAISPLDFDSIAASAERTGRLIVVHEAPGYFGSGAEIAAQITERCFYRLEAPVLRVAGYHTPYPPAKLEHDYLPSAARVRAAIDRALAY